MLFSMMLSMTLLARFLTVAALALGVEWYLIRHGKKCRWILPVLITVAVIAYSAHGQWWTRSSSGIREILVWDNHEYVGILQTAIDDEKHMHAVGRLVMGEKEEDLDFIDLEFEDGRLVGSERALAYEEPIKEALGRSMKGFTGKSVSYEQLEKAQDVIAEPVKEAYNWTGFARSLIFHSVVPIIAWAMVFQDFLRKRKQKQLRKMRISDL